MAEATNAFESGIVDWFPQTTRNVVSEMYHEHSMTVDEIASYYGVHRSQIEEIVAHRHPAHEGNTMDTKNNQNSPDEMTLTKYNRKTFSVIATQVTEENIQKVAEWCKGSVEKNTVEDGESMKVEYSVSVPVRPNPLTITRRRRSAKIGEWVVKAGERGFKVYTTDSLNKSFYQS